MESSTRFLIGVLVAILDFLPLFGTGTVLIPWALFKLLSADYPLAASLALLYVLTQVIRQVIQPKIVGDSMGLPPLWTLVFLYLGFKIHGISGMIIAVPLWNLCDESVPVRGVRWNDREREGAGEEIRKLRK
ncbi:MAG: AI-2E family transporter [Clostridium sp.]